PLVGRRLARRVVSARSRSTPDAATRVPRRRPRVPVRREGDGPTFGRVRGGSVHRILRELPPADELGLERIDRLAGLPGRCPPVPRTAGCAEARAIGRPPALPCVPSPVDDAPDARDDLGA